MNLDVERSELEDDGRCLGRDKPRGRLRENDLDETNQGQEMKENSGLREPLGASEP